MNIRKSIGIVTGLLLVLIGFAPRAGAQATNEGTRVTFREAIRIPGLVLQPGSYIFELAPSYGLRLNLDRIQIYNSDHTQLVDTIETVSAWRESATNGTMMTFAESSNGRPPALLQWFYPGMRDGHAFIYSARTERKLQAAKDDYVVSNTRGARLVADASGD